MMMRWGALLLGLGLLGCANKMPAGHAGLPAREATAGGFRAGAARIDVTPPPGVSMFGHGPGAGVAFGYWTRLLCRAFYLEPDGAPKDAFALVSCDLPAISTLLHRSVAGRARIPAARLVMTATHTHAGPGHYIESESFGGLGSSAFPGFDPAMVEFLATRIADAVKSAREGARPARLGWHKRQVWGLTRNRSPLPHAANRPPALWPVPAKMASREYAYQAIDPTLRVLRIEATDPGGAPREIGSLSFFAMHPTVIGSRNRFLGGDVYGVATRAVESEREPGSVHALFNTNEGDMSPAWVLGTPPEAVRIGNDLASRILAALRDEEPLQGKPALGMRYLEDHLPDAAYAVAPGGHVDRLCDSPVLGFNAMLGASDHPTVFDGLVAGLLRRGDPATGCQAPKLPMLGPLWKFASREASFPQDVPLALARIANTWISFVPGEPTITAGRRINDAVLEVAYKQTTGADAVTAGLANGYILYISTPEEYALQHYEGAATLYGPQTATFLASRYAFLALHLAYPATMTTRPTGYASAQVDEARDFAYHTGPERERLWRPEQDVALADLGTQRKPEGCCRMPSGPTPMFCGWWVDGGPAAVEMDRDALLEVTACEGTPCAPVGIGVSDLGMEFHTRIHDRVGDGWRWSTVFHPSARTWGALRSKPGIRLRVRGRGPAPSLDLPSLASARWCTNEELRSVCVVPW
jgi:neutral ceramidase